MNTFESVVKWLRRPVVRFSVLALAFGYIAWALADQWSEMRSTANELPVSWRWIMVATLVVLATYAALIQSWRLLLRGWGGTLPYGAAIRIWTISNLGRWIPGKIWSVGALSVLARDEGVSGTAAAGAALLGTALSIGAGFAVLVLAGARRLEAIGSGMSMAAVVFAVLFLVGVLVLPLVLPPILDRAARWRGLPAVTSHISGGVLWLATAINVGAWVAYGVAFAAFARGVTPAVSGNPALFIAVFCASYLIGYLALFSPGGLGIREVALVALMVALGMASRGDALILSVTSRLWLTILEVLPGLVSLLFMSPARRAGLRRHV